MIVVVYAMFVEAAAVMGWGGALGPHVSALMSGSEVFVGLPGVDIKSQDAALVVVLVAPRCIQGTYKPLRRGGDGPHV